MSSLIVEVCHVQKIEKHPHADKLQIAHIKGWQVVTALDQVKEGDKVVYIPPDSVLTAKIADQWGVSTYLRHLAKDQFGNRPEGGRVAVARLRGIPSFGFITPIENSEWEVGTDVAAHYGITKWEPPIESKEGDALPEVSAFHKYTDIENIRNFPDLIKEGELVEFTEKLHGKNARIGYIRTTTANGSQEFQFMAGSHSVCRKEFNANGKRSEFWEVISENLKSAIQWLSSGLEGEETRNVVVFGEIFGSGVQDMTYGMSNGKRLFRVFDIAIDGRYLNVNEKSCVADQYGFDLVEPLYNGPFSVEVMLQHTIGETTACDPSLAGKFSGREGIVITPLEERYVQYGENNNSTFTGRVILKSINPEYLLRNGGTEQH